MEQLEQSLVRYHPVATTPRQIRRVKIHRSEREIAINSAEV